MMRRTLIGISALTAFGLASCGKDSGKGNSNPVGAATSGQVIPASFQNTATDKTSFESNLQTLDTNVVTATSTALNASATTTLNVNFLGAFFDAGATATSSATTSGSTSGVGTSETSDSTASVDVTPFQADLKTGSDCASVYQKIVKSLASAEDVMKSRSSFLDKLDNNFRYTGTDSSVTVTDLKGSDSKYAFHLRMTPNADPNNSLSSMTPTIEVAAGSSGNQSVMLYQVDMDLTKLVQSSGSSQDVLKTSMQTTLYGDTDKKTLQIGSLTTADIVSQGKTTNITAKSAAVVTGGDLPSITQTTSYTGTQDNTPIAGDMTMSVVKVADGQFKLSFAGTANGQTLAKTLTVTNNGSKCSVQ